MAILKKYRNFEDLKSDKNLRIDNPLNSKALMTEFQDFIYLHLIFPNSK